MTAELVAIEMAAHGVSIVEIARGDEGWRPVLDSKYNRRVSPTNTPMSVDGPAAGHARMQTSADAIYCARHVGLKAGLPIETPALTVNRLCGSGFQAIIGGAEQIVLGETDAVLVAGTENMTQAPFQLRGAREGWSFGKAPPVEDSLWSALTDSYCNTPMAVTAENLAQKYGITRQQCDEYALASQQRRARRSRPRGRGGTPGPPRGAGATQPVRVHRLAGLR